MSQVIDFKSKETLMSTPSSNSLVKEILQHLTSEADDIQDIIVFTKYKNDEFILSHSGPKLGDKALTVQLLQHDINADINSLMMGVEDIAPES